MYELRDIRAGYGQAEVLAGIGLSVPSGTVVTLLGANGAGKTTLLRVASGLLRPTSGSLVLDGVVLGRPSADDLARRGVCHIPEGRGVFRSLTVRDNILLGAVVDDPLQLAADAFPILGQRLGQRAGTMSGGEQQMLAVVRSYLSAPSFVLLDEVSLGLAPRVVDEIFDFLRRLADQGVALLLVEQYVARALAIADIVYVLDRGMVAFAGEPGQLGQAEVAHVYLGLPS